MRIGVIGSGDVGRALSVAFLGRGDQVTIGTRDPAKLETWRAERAPKARVGSFSDAAEFGELVALATLWTGTESALDQAGPQRFRGKTLMDVTNPLDFSRGAPPGLAVGHTDSAGEQVQRWLPDARVVKAFNTVGNALFYKPNVPCAPPSMLYCGNDEGAKAQVRKVIEDFAWEPIDIGGIEGARLLEPLCILWIVYGARSGTWGHAFKLLHG